MRRPDPVLLMTLVLSPLELPFLHRVLRCLSMRMYVSQPEYLGYLSSQSHPDFKSVEEVITAAEDKPEWNSITNSLCPKLRKERKNKTGIDVFV